MSFFTNHTFWGLLVLACVLWYSTITLVVAFKGVADIRNMLAELKKKRPE